MKISCVCALIVCFASISTGRVLEEASRDTVCAFYLDAPTSLSDDPSAKAALVTALKNLAAADVSIRFNNGTNDVAVFLDSPETAKVFCDAVVTNLGSSVHVLQSAVHSLVARKCTYDGSCKWWWGGCQLYRTCGKGYVSGGSSGAGDLYGKACTSSCRTRCYSYCQCPSDTSCYGK